MKLAEALQIRADLQRRLAQMPSRLAASAKVQEGSLPVEKPESLLSEMKTLLEQLERLTVDINLTNSSVRDDDGKTLTALIAHRDMLRAKVEMTRNFLNAASDIVPRHTSTDIRVLSTVDVPAMRKECDRISRELRETDVKIQGMNWNTELIES